MGIIDIIIIAIGCGLGIAVFYNMIKEMLSGQ